MLIIWGLSVVYRTLGRGVFFCRRCGGDREYRHRSGRRYVTVFFIPLLPLMKTGEHVQCLTCKTRYVTEVLKLPTTVQMQVALVAGMRSMVAIILRAGDPANPLSRRRAIDALTGAGDSGYDEDTLEADLAESADTARPKISALGGQLQIEAREWCLAEAIRIAMADGPLTGTERAAAEHLASMLSMTRAQAIGVIALTEQNTVLPAGGGPVPPRTEGFPSVPSPPGTPRKTLAPALWLWLRPCDCCGKVLTSRSDEKRPGRGGGLGPGVAAMTRLARLRTRCGLRGYGRCGVAERGACGAGSLLTDMSHELLLLSGRGGGL